MSAIGPLGKLRQVGELIPSINLSYAGRILRQYLYSVQIKGLILMLLLII